MKLKSALGITALLAALGSCSDQNSVHKNDSEIKDIATPGSPGDANVLFWIEDDHMHMAACSKGVPTTRANCNLQVAKSPSADVVQKATAAATAEYDRVNGLVSAEVKALKDSDPTVVALNSEIQILTTQKATLDKAVTTAKSQIDAWTSEKSSKEVQIAHDDLQLAAIAKALEATPNDVDLLKQQADYRAERDQYAADVAALNDLINKTSARMAYDKSTLAGVVTELADSQAQLKKVYAELQVTSPKLDSLVQALNLSKKSGDAIPQVVTMIHTSAIIYRGNGLSDAAQEALRLISISFKPQYVLNPGRYQVESGYSSYCPQKAEPTMVGTVLKSVKLTYLSPCGGASDVYSCSGNLCTSSSYRMRVMDPTHYSFNSGYGDAVMKFVSPSLSDGGSTGGPKLDSAL